MEWVEGEGDCGVNFDPTTQLDMKRVMIDTKLSRSSTYRDIP